MIDDNISWSRKYLCVFVIVAVIGVIMLLFSPLLERPYADQIRDSAQRYAYHTYPGRPGKIVCNIEPNSFSHILPCSIHFDDGTRVDITCMPRHCDGVQLPVEFTNTK